MNINLGTIDVTWEDIFALVSTGLWVYLFIVLIKKSSIERYWIDYIGFITAILLILIWIILWTKVYKYFIS